MTTLKELRDEHAEVFKRLEKLETALTELVEGQLLEGASPVLELPAFIEKAILPHFTVEERILFPLLAGGSEEERKLREELMADHLYLRDCFFAYLRGVRQNVVSDGFLAGCRDMMYRLLTHAKKEDIYLIPLLRKLLGIAENEPLPAHAPPILYENNSDLT